MPNFDEQFQKMLQDGDRELCARYRNCIIDEFRRRSKCKEDAIMVKSNLVAQHEKIAKQKRWHLFSVIVSMIGVVAALNAVFSQSAQESIAFKICAVVLVIFNALFLLKNFLGALLLTEALKNMEGTVVLITKPAGVYYDLPESFRPISNDSDEILQGKKETLDDILGF